MAQAKLKPRREDVSQLTTRPISTEGGSKIVEQVNAWSRTPTLYVKTKNFHWHVSGPISDYHLLLDDRRRRSTRR